MKKFLRKGKKFVVLATVLTFVALPAFTSNGPAARALGGGDIWLIGGW
ncbi:hypothetical protein [Jeotgalibaca caeni]|nr:hypothetical protein [Jeotgalibaca caeni]MDE1548592.1 hypothetical protein [Jeotgalibaca caeni]